jgi:nicotinamidase-related amidase
MPYPNLDKSLFAAVDVQREFCDPVFSERGNVKTDRIAKRIAAFSNILHDAGLPICWIYFDEQLTAKEHDRIKSKGLQHLELVNQARFNHAGGGPHYVAADDGHFLIPKNEDSAFMSRPSPFRDLLIQRQTSDIIVTGFNYSACVWKTIQDALLEGYNIYLVRDLCGNDNKCSDSADDYIREAYFDFQQQAQEQQNIAQNQASAQAEKGKTYGSVVRPNLLKTLFNAFRGQKPINNPSNSSCAQRTLGQLHFIDARGLAVHVQQWQNMRMQDSTTLHDMRMDTARDLTSGKNSKVLRAMRLG